ncbi:hypothetical protein UY3_19271 [Chelonia mydas]|uniref:Uncharacterized protein n=1 Tax=Chelonia mydas TaxID=8469 RepID=M7AH63_CHEMY|nr:hypothetical protein UY3_19271 [Chelonia mydas]
MWGIVGQLLKASNSQSGSAGSDRSIGDIFIVSRLEAINRPLNVLPVDSGTPAHERQKRSQRGSGSGRLAAVLTARWVLLLCSAPRPSAPAPPPPPGRQTADQSGG